MNTEIKDKQIGILIFYLIGVVFLIPILSYYFSIPDILPKQAYIQVYLSGPILIILGLLLFFLYRKKLIGVIFLVIGTWWMLNIVYELMTK